jgi:hypothetical protein
MITNDKNANRKEILVTMCCLLRNCRATNQIESMKSDCLDGNNGHFVHLKSCTPSDAKSTARVATLALASTARGALANAKKQAALPPVTGCLARNEKKGPLEIRLSVSSQNFRTKRRASI